jgi:hypothetical protein
MNAVTPAIPRRGVEKVFRNLFMRFLPVTTPSIAGKCPVYAAF